MLLQRCYVGEAVLPEGGYSLEMADKGSIAYRSTATDFDRR